MQIEVENKLTELQADTLVVGVWCGGENGKPELTPSAVAVDKAGGLISAQIEAGDFKGKPSEVAVFYGVAELDDSRSFTLQPDGSVAPRKVPPASSHASAMDADRATTHCGCRGACTVRWEKSVSATVSRSSACAPKAENDRIARRNHSSTFFIVRPPPRILYQKIASCAIGCTASKDKSPHWKT